MRISVIGAGYVGIVTAACLADRGIEVICSTHNEKNAQMINKGAAPFYEKDLEPMLKKAVKKGKLHCTTNREEAILNTDITFVTVGTPMRSDGSIDLSFIEQAAQEIGKALKNKREYQLIVVRSTVVPGTTRNLIGKKIEENGGKKLGESIGLCMQPEFLREGEAVNDTLNPDMIVIGELDKTSGDILESLQRKFYGEKCPTILRMNIESAEMVKYANNCFLATKISFANEIANICELVPRVDVKEVMKAIGFDHRINPKFLDAGAGWGGSCFAKDLNAMKAFSTNLGYKPKIITATLEVNEMQAKHIVELAEMKLGTLRDKRIALLGLSFKPNTDDMRDAPSIRISNNLVEKGATVVGYDPYATENAKKAIGEKISYAKSIDDCLKGADCAILVTEWDVFKDLKPIDFLKNMKQPILIDARRIYNPKEFSNKLQYIGIGMSNR
ncbi:MAG: UDP-glucose/GDP-mannose dehydrogenase family protein [Euryarchaeota archaeon]|nr:UDP-glucose/GDP-mannose dehydrogenase family protein [Euryarchaeota archaeon]